MRSFRFCHCMLIAFLLVSTGCQQSRSSLQQKPIPPDEQIEQLASVSASAKYLKYQCHRSDLPSDAVMTNAIDKVARQRGWDIAEDKAVSQRSEQIYQHLQRDSTPESTKCSSFNRLLKPFIDDLPTAFNGQ